MNDGFCEKIKLYAHFYKKMIRYYKYRLIRKIGRTAEKCSYILLSYFYVLFF